MAVQHTRIKRKLEEAEGYPPDQIMVLTDVLCDVVHRLSQHVTRLDKRCDGVASAVDDQRAKLKDHSATVKKDISEFAMALSETVEHVRMLEASSLGNDAATKLLDVRRGYTMARSDVARGFTLVLPKFLNVTGFLSELEWEMPVNLWHMFLLKLTEHYRLHFDVQSRPNGTYLFRPRRSVFHYLLEEERYSPNGPYFATLPNTAIVGDFRSEADHQCNEIGRFGTETIEEFFGRVLKFFAPLIIWEHSVVKKETEQTGAEIESLNAALAEQHNLIRVLSRGGTVEEAVYASQQRSQAGHTSSASGGTPAPLKHQEREGMDPSLKADIVVGISNVESSGIKVDSSPQIERPPINSALINHLEGNVGVFEKEIKKALEKQRSCTHRLNVLQRCLRVLGDEKLLNLAISGSSRVYDLIKAGALEVELPFKQLEAAWTTIKKARTGDVDSQEVFDSSKALQETEKVETLETNEDEVDGASSNTEKEIDNFIEAQTRYGMNTTNPDYLILSQWMESVNPAQTDQEPKTTDSKGKGKAT
ncbi:hypothetical protein ACEPAG_9376 [Sanghuangporus baumii]